MIHHPRCIVAFRRIEPDYARRMVILASMARYWMAHPTTGDLQLAE